MSPTARWIAGIAGLIFAAVGFVSITVGTQIWSAVVLGGVVATIGFEAARRSQSWAGALLALVGICMVTLSFVGGVQTGAAHLWASLLAGLTVVGIAVFVHDGEVTPV